MDNIEENQTPQEEQALIDIFYKDTYRLESIISQIDNGALQTVITTMDSKQGSSSHIAGSIGVPSVLGSNAKNVTSESEEQHIQKTKKSLDDAIIELLSKLDIVPQGKNFSKACANLNIVTGNISLSNYNIISKIIPILQNGNILFDSEISEKTIIKKHIDLLKGLTSKSKAVKDKIAELENTYYEQQMKVMRNEMFYDNLQAFVPFLPKGLGFTIKTSDETIFGGSLKTEYLIDSEEDILMNYGSTLPGEWNILGIIDFKGDSNEPVDSSDIMNTLSSSMQISLEQLFPQNKDATIIPLLIYRELNIYDN